MQAAIESEEPVKLRWLLKVGDVRERDEEEEEEDDYEDDGGGGGGKWKKRSYFIAAEERVRGSWGTIISVNLKPEEFNTCRISITKMDARKRGRY